MYECPLGSGAEGTVYRVGDGTVAKVWSVPRDIEPLRRVYAELDLPFATPRIHEVTEHEGSMVTYERELPGVPLGPDSAVYPMPERLDPSSVDAAVHVLRGLATAPGTEALRRLTVVGDDRPLWQDQETFAGALAALVDRRSALLREHVPRLPEILRWVHRGLATMPVRPATLIHGDLVPPNIHVDEAGIPCAVLDFGFCTTAGDPAFDAAITAAGWDMYGPHAAAHRAELTRHFATELGYPVQDLVLYQAIYALSTYDAFGVDGHFHWCVNLLN
ncbi:aminoglycoside phosphotransferase family protein [Pseudonocardiaceae bacterium YIM PH 21723]|nr:aminoglycoside phosphotransferase family protein [Pseudonocardiaceae bacterium YIM PH 21723]